ncbi:MAG: HEAT repeat domain-containing protein [Planctomycetes bacterium]|nr:HEAT repeat domain-containing protein [Planctomycetota bacterium]
MCNDMGSARSASAGRFTFLILMAGAGLMIAGPVSPALGQAAGSPVSGSSSSADDGLRSLYENFLHFARLGRFDAADAYAGSLLAHGDLTPIRLLELADSDPRSIDTLTFLVANSTVGDNAAAVLEVIRQGEFERRQDRDRIQANVEKLGGHPQMEFNAIQRLQESGEYAVPWMIQALMDPARSDLHPRIVSALPKLGKPAVSPLVAVLDTSDPALRRFAVDALGEIGYPQALPYLGRLLATPDLPSDLAEACVEAIDRIVGRRGYRADLAPAGQFVALADQYYREAGSVRADPRLEWANVWRWDADAQFLDHVTVSRDIFGPVMAMDCCNNALDLESGNVPALSLWLAANVRREARLGFDVESGDPNEQAAPDESRPDDFPRAIYFSRTAGPAYCQRVLARAVRDHDADVALGAIAALRAVAGSSSLIGDASGQEPLVQALRFPNALVRIKAALALAESLPRSPFYGSETVVPTLAAAVLQTRGLGMVVVDPDEAALNRLLEGLGAEGVRAVGHSSFYPALDRARRELDWVSGFVLASNSAGPDVHDAIGVLDQDADLRNAPVILLSNPSDEMRMDDLAATDDRITRLDAAADAAVVIARLDAIAGAVGSYLDDQGLALDMAVQAAHALRLVAVDGRSALDPHGAEYALIRALQVGGDENLQVAAADALAGLATAQPQHALAVAATDAGNTRSLRVAACAALAESAKRNGNLLDEPELNALINIAIDEADLTLRTAASQATGALNIAPDTASEVVRRYRS